MYENRTMKPTEIVPTREREMRENDGGKHMFNVTIIPLSPRTTIIC
jgi:hypothetical protein